VLEGLHRSLRRIQARLPIYQPACWRRPFQHEVHGYVGIAGQAAHRWQRHHGALDSGGYVLFRIRMKLKASVANHFEKLARQNLPRHISAVALGTTYEQSYSTRLDTTPSFARVEAKIT